MKTTMYVGDTRKVLATLPDASVDLVVTSPPYLALRSYLPEGDTAKADEMGSERSPGEFLDALLDVTEELRRVLSPHGSLCVELGDTYSGSGGAGGDYNAEGLREGQPKFGGSASRASGFPLAKSLCMIPESYRWALAYGRNPFTGRETPCWRVRNVVRHFRPNPPVGALGDKFRPATSDWVVACVSPQRYFDLDAVRQPPQNARPPAAGNCTKGHDENSRRFASRLNSNEAGAPPLDWWDDDLEWRDSAGFIASTSAYAGAHYATFSPAVIQRLIEPMCPRRVCLECGLPSERITDKTDCGHDAWRGGIVLDPFGGSGTTGQVANGLGLDAILIDLDARNVGLARQRCGMFFELAENPVYTQGGQT